MPLSPKKIITTVGEERQMADTPSRIRLLGRDREALESVREALVGGAGPGAEGAVDLTVISAGGGDMPRVDPDSTAVAIVTASWEEVSADGMEDALAGLHDSGVPVVLVLSEAPGVELAFPQAGIGPRHVVGIAPDGRTPPEILAEAVIDAAGDASASLAARLPALREEACRQIIRKTARQNAVIGALFVIPGADMPVMTMNQARMLLRIAAAHGESVGMDRALELAGVVGGGFGLRAIARQALGLLAGPGWIIKSGIAYSGTRVMGQAAKSYFDGSARVTPAKLAPLFNKLKQLRG